MPRFSRPLSFVRPVGKGFIHAKAPDPNPGALAIAPYRHGRKLSPETKTRISDSLLKSAIIKAATLGMQSGGPGFLDGMSTAAGWAMDAAAGKNRTNSTQSTQYNLGSNAVREARQRMANGQLLDPNKIPSTLSTPGATSPTAVSPGQPDQSSGSSISGYKTVQLGDGHEKEWYQPQGDVNDWASWSAGGRIGAQIDPALMAQSKWNWRPDHEQGWERTIDGQQQMSSLQQAGFGSIQEAANAYQNLDLSKPLDARGQQAYLAQASRALGKPVTTANMAELTGMEFTPDGKVLPANQARYDWAEAAAKQKNMSLDDFTRAGYRVGANGAVFDPGKFGGNDYNKDVTRKMLMLQRNGYPPELAAKMIHNDMIANGQYADVGQIRNQYEKIMGKGMFDDKSLSELGYQQTAYGDGVAANRGDDIYGQVGNLAGGIGGAIGSALGPNSGAMTGSLANLGSSMGLYGLGGAGMAGAGALAGFGGVSGNRDALKQYMEMVGRPELTDLDRQRNRGSMWNPFNEDNIIRRIGRGIVGHTGIGQSIFGETTAADRMANEIAATRSRADWNSKSFGENAMDAGMDVMGFNPANIVQTGSAFIGDWLNGEQPREMDPVIRARNKAIDAVSRSQSPEARGMLFDDQIGQYLGDLSDEDYDRQRNSFMYSDGNTPEGRQNIQTMLQRYGPQFLDSYGIAHRGMQQ